MKVICVLKRGPRYSEQYVHALYRAVQRYAPDDMEFHCLTDYDPADFNTDIYVRALQHDWQGWWSKLELFRPGLFPIGERVLYFDLDTLILRDISTLITIVEHGPGFLMLRGFNREVLARGDVPASGIMGYAVGDSQVEKLWQVFSADPDYAIKTQKQRGKGAGQQGDQGLIGAVLGWGHIAKLQDYLPEGYIQGKRHTQQPEKPEAHVVAWSGLPNFPRAQVLYPWIKKAWLT